MRKRIFTISIYACLSINLIAQLPYQNKALSAEDRANDLVNRLTLEEKVSLMMNDSKAIPRLEIKKYEWWNEALHGVARNGTATVFPQAVGMAASFDDSLLNKVFTAVSDEARIKHRQASEKGEYNRYQGLSMWTPNINIFRDPRWGRGQETYGEDPYLTGKMGVAVITGLQGNGEEKIDKLHACAKHFAVHSGPEWSRHKFNAENISPRDLRETYLPAFKAAVQKGNVKEVMCAYNSFEGEPCCGSNRLLVQILRNEWGYKGIVLSDCGAINDFYNPGAHQTHANAAQASSAAVLNGTDLECGGSYKSIPEAVHQGLISEDRINTSVKRLMKARFELGEMDGASPWDKLPDTLVNGYKHHQLALQMAQKSMVLLQNNGILPLNHKSSIAILGPNANDSVMQWGNYNGTPKRTITLLEAMRLQLPDAKIIYDEACGLTDKAQSLFDQCHDKGEKGFSVSYWNNIEMKGQPVVETQVESAVKVNKATAFADGVNLTNFSVKYHTTFTPALIGPVQFVFTTQSKVRIVIDGKESKPDSITKSLRVLSLEVKAGKPYDVEVELVRGKESDGFRFDIQRTVKNDFSKTIEKVKNADVIIFAGGISASLEREEANVFAPGFKGGDRTSIELPQIQRDFVAALKAAGKKVILVNYSGSAIGLVPESKLCDAILQAWYPGEAGGTAVADVLLGNYNPSGRLPVTFYKNADQLPDFEDYNMKGHTYRYMKEKPLFPFGYGLSYTTFKYGKPSLSKQQIKTGDAVTLTVPVTNAGKCNGEEVVQVYLKKINDDNGPDKTLRAFKRINIPAGETANVSFELTDDNLEWWNPETYSVSVHKGDYQLMVGSSSRNEDLTTLNLQIQ
ncbi:MAG: xylan 1,4-beta-xylosidase [Bacteroidota bacterium]|nr:xylan 1,4-beta-xylosidase [Bacteroidota bacterium]